MPCSRGGVNRKCGGIDSIVSTVLSMLRALVAAIAAISNLDVVTGGGVARCRYALPCHAMSPLRLDLDLGPANLNNKHYTMQV